ncbi:beta galactosidase jelly roll domain-containing protein [Rhodocaloribacter litoris]|uniref:glycoside hydrolase family 2 protein n=1 Tax=Rhodocaloribacter litoris TaxID=2558931 RepID=UPI00141E1C3B|nr:glycoside hydrolase family 2 TIM barrel-domain containing protein [Rhodocaloribacter litoris]QXD13826.1 beta galactosidase jelly roll domain-containing protein [Rhodocaloribacter litoris]
MLLRLAPLLLVVASPAFAQVPDRLLQNVYARDPLVLDGRWGVVIDPFETGYYNHRYEIASDGFFRDRKMTRPWELIEYDFDAGPALHVPGDWNTQDDRLFFYEGTVWYKRAFPYTPASDRRAFLYFGAANYEAHVYLNGERIGHHVGGFTPFNIEVTEHLRDGENVLIVKVDNRRRHDGVPTVNFDWWNYGGLTRSVLLVTTPATFIRDYVLQLDPDTPEVIRGGVQLDGPEAAGRPVTVAIPEANLHRRFTTDAQGYAAVELPATGLARWSPADPKRYEVILQAGEDTLTDEIGFRTIERRGEDILLNGKPIFLRGVSLHEERPFGGGRAATPEAAAVLLGWAREMNCNFVRLAHYPHNEHMVRTAERLGLLVWAEVPVYWTVQFENPAVYALAEQQVTEMVMRDRNRAAVILWSVANETPLSEARLAFLSRLAATIRRLDPTRLVTAALDTQRHEEGILYIDDPLAGVVDVIGINSYCGWYGPALPEACAGLRWQSDYGKPVIMSEFGGGALQGYHGTALDRWTETYQASVYEHNLAMLDRIPFLRGTSPWILKDFRSPRRPLPRIQDFWNRKGLVSDAGLRKKAFYLMQAWYRDKAAEWGW